MTHLKVMYLYLSAFT